MSESNSKELARRGAEHALEVIGLGGAVAATMGMPGIGLGAVAVVTASKMALTTASKRRQEKQAERSRLLIEDLHRRLSDVEAATLEESSVDLFAEVFMRAIEDDDARKIVFHGAFIAWMAKAKRHPCDARLFGEAVAGLTFEELRGFVMWGRNGGGFRTEVYLGGTCMSDSMVYQRFDAMGLLTQDGVRGTQFFSEIGKALVEECKNDEI